MATLRSGDFRDVGTGTSPAVGAGLEQDSNLAYQARIEDPIRKGNINPERQLPEAGNHRLNRTAVQIGGALGKVVSQARRAPKSARRGLHVVRDRAQEAGASAATSASSLAESAQQRGALLLDAAEARGRILLDKAEALTRNVAERASQVKQQLGDRSRELQQAARLRTQQAKIKAGHLINERPLQVLGGIAAAAFITGVSLRIVRSRNASRY